MQLHSIPQHNNKLPANIRTDVPLQDKNWFGTGGSARFYSAPETAPAFQEALLWAHEHHMDIFVMGTGANVLISDTGFDGLVIVPHLQHLHIDGTTVTAGAGITMDRLISFCLEHHLLGLEEFSGIPGTVGGSVYINLHYFEFLLEQFLLDAQVINRTTGQIMRVDRTWFAFGYNYSRLHDEQWYLVDARFNLKTASAYETAYACGRRDEIIRHRMRRYPTTGTCGSFFRNFRADEVTYESNGTKILHVAYYLDKLGLKGNYSVGGAAVSWQHANMIVNTGTATSADIIAVARHMQQTVYNAYGMVAQPECRLVGFHEYPLMDTTNSI
jgi:UDP-N-acetylmuramate dehydrogenase